MGHYTKIYISTTETTCNPTQITQYMLRRLNPVTSRMSYDRRTNSSTVVQLRPHPGDTRRHLGKVSRKTNSGLGSQDCGVYFHFAAYLYVCAVHETGEK